MVAATIDGVRRRRYSVDMDVCEERA